MGQTKGYSLRLIANIRLIPISTNILTDHLSGNVYYQKCKYYLNCEYFKKDQGRKNNGFERCKKWKGNHIIVKNARKDMQIVHLCMPKIIFSKIIKRVLGVLTSL